VLSLFTVASADEGIALARRLLEFHGAGHTAGIHTRDQSLMERFGRAVPAGRILVNSPSVQGVVGLASGLEPSFTLPPDDAGERLPQHACAGRRANTCIARRPPMPRHTAPLAVWSHGIEHSRAWRRASPTPNSG
jgi:hypothetical protein